MASRDRSGRGSYDIGAQYLGRLFAKAKTSKKYRDLADEADNFCKIIGYRTSKETDRFTELQDR